MFVFSWMVEGMHHDGLVEFRFDRDHELLFETETLLSNYVL